MGSCRAMVLVTILLLANYRTAGASPCDRLPAWLKVTEVVFRVVEATNNHDVKVTFPKVADLKCAAFPYDWGTDYVFKLSMSSPVTIQYFKSGSTIAIRKVEMSDSLAAESVLIAAERERTPHYFGVRDEELEVDYHIYLTPDKGPSHAKRKGTKDKLKIISFK